MWKAMMFPLALVITAATATQAGAQCGPHREVLKRLAEQHQELPVAVGIADNGRLIEVLASRDGATWTLIVTTPRGVSCLVASGQDWQTRDSLAFLPRT